MERQTAAPSRRKMILNWLALLVLLSLGINWPPVLGMTPEREPEEARTGRPLRCVVTAEAQTQ